MSQNTLSLILKRIDAPVDPVFSHDEVRLWPDGDLELMEKLGLLRETAPAKSVECDGCEEACIEDVIYIDGPKEGQIRAYVACHSREDVGRIDVPLERLKRWAVDPVQLAAAFKKLIGAEGKMEETIEGRLWWLGDARLNNQKVGIFLAFGVAWPDAVKVFSNARRLEECAIPFVFVPSQAISDFPIPANGKTLHLDRFLSVQDHRLELDLEEIRRLVSKSRLRATKAILPLRLPTGTTWEQVQVEFINDETVKIVAGSIVEHKTFADMGFCDRRKYGERPDELWSHFRTMAKQKGCISWSDDVEDIDESERTKLKKWMSDLRKRLREYFGIPDDPFQPYRQYKAYQTKFILSYPDSKSDSR